ncbi:MAG: hypothetical protein NTU80_08205 [Verrucomicrobia bacterium]|nr:hypothetical protein [Verrucomicrobiota bacterium]
MLHRARWFFAAPAVFALLAGCAHRADHAFRVSPVAETRSGSATIPPGDTVTAPVPVAVPEAVVAPPEPSKLVLTPATAVDAFEVRFVVTTQSAYGDLFSRTLDNIVPDYVEAAQVYRGQRAYVIPLIRHYRLNADGCADVVLELETRKPDGTRDGDVLRVSLWDGPVVGMGLILYPKTNVSFWTEANDAPGPYTLVARVIDQVSKESREFTHSIVMRDYVPPPLPADFSAALWYSTYYANPTPELALPALTALYWSQPADRRQANMSPLLGFYDQVLLDNPWLLPIFAGRLAMADTDEAYVLSLVLGFHWRKATTAPPWMDGDTWTRLAEFRVHDWDLDADAVITEAGQLEALWGRFFANGSYSAIRSLLGPLANYPDLGAGERWRQARSTGTSPDAPSEIPPEVKREQLLRSTVWALRNNSRQHPLLQAYLNWTLRFGRIPLPQKMFLTRILGVETPAATAAPSP